MAGLLALAREQHRNAKAESYCANWYFYRDLKPKLLLLVGYERRPAHALLSSEAAYDVASDAIYEALPNCRKCGCISLEAS